MRVRTLVLAVAAGLLAAPQPALARRPSAPVLGAVTKVTATTSGYVDVVVPYDAKLSPLVDANPDVTFSGSGRFVALWLQRITEGDLYDGLWAYRLPAFAGGKTQTYGSTFPGVTCTHFPNEQLPLHSDCQYPKPESILLHRGRYRLTVVTDDAPVTVTLRLRGLLGTRTVRPSHRLTTVQQGLPQRETVSDRLVTFGAVMRVPAYSDVYVVARGTFSSPPGVREESVCRRNAADASRPYAFAPPCLGGHSGSQRTYVDATVRNEEIWNGFVSTYGTEDESIGIGGSFGDSDGVTFGGALAVAIEVPR